jgi:uncharacterized membrane protein (UPF0127 family)
MTTLAVALAGCGRSPVCTASPAQLVIRSPSGRSVLDVEVPDSPQQQARGLMGRSHLGANDGMAFVFTSPTTDAFWMKDTTIPLSIAFWDSRGRIVDVLDMTPCRAAPCRRYRSRRPYVGAVEANRGYFARHGIGIGDRVRLESAACQL